MAYWDTEEDIDLHIRHGLAPRRPDRRAYSPVVLPEHRPRALARPPYNHVQSGYLFAEQPPAGGLYRSRSQGHRALSPPAPPLIIQNRIDNYFEEDIVNNDRMRSPAVYSPERPSQSRSHSRHASPPTSSSHSKDAWELEKVRKELEGYKLEEQREQEERRIKHELELKRLREEKKEEEEKERRKLEQEKIIKEFKQKEAERVAKEKKEKEEREKEYKQRLEEDLRIAGIDEGRIAVVLKKEKAVSEHTRPTYTRMSRRHLSIETLNKYRIDYELDQDTNYVLIKRWVPEWEQDFLWNHTREIREKRVLLLEYPHHHHHGRERQVEYGIVRRERKRRSSPSTLLTLFAGGR